MQTTCILKQSKGSNHAFRKKKKKKTSSILLPTHEIISNSITIDDDHKFSFDKQYCMPLEHGLSFFSLSPSKYFGIPILTCLL